MTTTRYLTPGQWRPGDVIGHRDGVRSRHAVRRPGLVTVTAIEPTNRVRNRFRVDWSTPDGETGHFFIRNQFAEPVER